MKITDIRYFSHKINDDVIKQIADSINEGFEILKMETNWVTESSAQHQTQCSIACIIAILVKREV